MVHSVEQSANGVVAGDITLQGLDARMRRSRFDYAVSHHGAARGNEAASVRHPVSLELGRLPHLPAKGAPGRADTRSRPSAAPSAS
ncbi:MAG: hypothetical protein KC731_08425, partial [Myxococcales bacterium]|nr:hypothetical protein [Myxococcales bacterium]